MSAFDAQIRDLPTMTVVTAQATSRHPEEDALRKLAAWAEPAGLLDDPSEHPVFGFNNPQPEPGQPVYGYEFWIKVDPATPPVSGLGRKEFPGGRYAVTTCRLQDDPHGSLPEIWRLLVRWTEEHGYRWRQTHELEHLLNPGAPQQEIELELYLPIEKD